MPSDIKYEFPSDFVKGGASSSYEVDSLKKKMKPFLHTEAEALTSVPFALQKLHGSRHHNCSRKVTASWWWRKAHIANFCA